MKKFTLLFLLTFVLFQGCHYRFGQGSLIDRCHTIAVPYVTGDDQGLLTNEIVRQINIKGVLQYVNDGADLILKVCLSEPTDDNIGFIIVKDDDGSDNKVVAANEARLTVFAKVQVIETATNQTLIGPIDISATLTYDFEPDYSRFNAQQFSLGQLDTQHLAQDAAIRPLFKQLAEKIVDYINYAW